MKIMVNGHPMALPIGWEEESLLQTLREGWGLVGAKFGCSVGLCGACTVLLDGQPVRACLVSTRDAHGRSVTTIEGLAQGDRLHPVQQAWLDESVPQCGYCQAGQVMSAVALLRRIPRPTDDDVTRAMAGNLCRCGTQQRIRAAVHRVVMQRDLARRDVAEEGAIDGPAERAR